MIMMIDENMLQYALFLAQGLLVASGIFSVMHKNKKAQFAISTILLVAIALTASSLFASDSSIVPFSAFRISQFSMFFISLFSILLVLVNIISYEYSQDYISFSALFGFTIAGMYVVTMANSLISVFLGIELMALPTAFMIMINGKQGIESAVKLFVMAATAIAAFSFALALVFPFNAQLSLTALHIGSGQGNYLVLLAVVLFVISLAFEASLFPFNLWVPDVYQGAQGNITAMMSGINKKVAFVAIMEVFFIALVPLSSVFSQLFIALAIATMFYGNIVALVQDNVKRLFAYSSISQAGYIMIGIAVATQYGIEASIFQIVAHALAIIAIFAVILWLEENNIKSLKDYTALSRRNGFAASTLTILMLSLIGIPPLIGFVGKFLLFTSAIYSNLLFLAAIGIFNSFISVYYYAKVIMAMYSKKEEVRSLRMGWSVSAVSVISVIAVLVLGLVPQFLIAAASQASAALLAI